MLLQRCNANENALREKRQPEIRLRSQAITKTFYQNLKCKKILLYPHGYVSFKIYSLLRQLFECCKYLCMQEKATFDFQ